MKNKITVCLLLVAAGCATPVYTPAPAKAPPTPAPPAPKLVHPLVIIPSAASSAAQAQVQVLVSRKVTPPPAVTLAWIASTDPTVAAYDMYYGTASGAYSTVVPAGNASSVTISNLAFGTTYFFAATGITAGGIESVYSNEASWQSPSLPLPPGNLIIQSSFAGDVRGPWLTDTNWPPIIVSNPLGNQLWRLDAQKIP